MGFYLPIPVSILPELRFLNQKIDTQNRTLYCTTQTDSDLFIGSSFGSLYRLELATNKLTTLPSKIFTSNIQSLAVGQNNRIIAGASGRGIYVSDDNGETFTQKQAFGGSSYGGASNDGNIVLSFGQNVYVSIDNGENWALTAVALGNTGTAQTLKYYPELGQFWRVSIDGRVAFSSTGLGWTVINHSAEPGIGSTYGQALFNGRIYFIGNNILRSVNLLGVDFQTHENAFYNSSTLSGSNNGSLSVKNDILFIANGIGAMYSTDGDTFYPCYGVDQQVIDTVSASKSTYMLGTSSTIGLFKNIIVDP